MHDQYGPILQEHDDSSSTLVLVMPPPAPRRVKVLVLVLEHAPGRRKYQRMLDRGWTVDSAIRRPLSRAVTVTFSRPRSRR